jgi:hypothetical protein
LIRALLEDEGVGEKEGGVGFAEVEADALLLGGGTGLAQDYSVSFTLLYVQGSSQGEACIMLTLRID